MRQVSPSSSRSLTTLAGVALLSPALLACLVPVGQRTETQYVVTQQARLPAPEGPKSIGTMTEQGKLSLQGGFSYSYVQPGETNEERAALGHLIHDRTMHARLGFGIGKRLELGLGGTYSHNTWTTATSDMTPQDAPDGPQSHKFLASLQSRFILAGNRKTGIGFIAEGDFGTSNYRRTTQITTTTVLINIDGSETRLPPTVEREQESDTDFFWVAKGGVQGFYSLLPWLSINGGMMAQNYPRYWARRVMGTTCEDDFIYDEQPATCDGSTPDDVNARNMLLLGTVFAGASLEHPSLPLSAHLQVHANALAPKVVRDAVPVGAMLALRLTL